MAQGKGWVWGWRCPGRVDVNIHKFYQFAKFFLKELVKDPERAHLAGDAKRVGDAIRAGLELYLKDGEKKVKDVGAMVAQAAAGKGGRAPLVVPPAAVAPPVVPPAAVAPPVVPPAAVVAPVVAPVALPPVAVILHPGLWPVQQSYVRGAVLAMLIRVSTKIVVFFGHRVT